MMKKLKICSLFLCFSCYSLCVFAQPQEEYGISILNVKTGEVIEAINLPNSPSYNPTFSNNGKKIAYDTYFGIYITDLTNGDTYPLEGGEMGNDASWSPDGKNIVFDLYGNEIQVVSSSGGIPQFVTYGFDAEWNNSSNRIVYSLDGGLNTIKIDGSGMNTLSNFGRNPSWSKNGKQIAFTDGENLWIVAVNNDGSAAGAPQQITFDGSGIYNQQPSWSNNGKSIVFHSNRTTNNFDFDIWEVNVGTGVISHLTGYFGVSDYDPCYSKNGQYVAYSTVGNAIVPALAKKALAKLHESFPNPFQSSTIINIEVEESGHVQVFVFDQLGRTISKLVNTNLDAGQHKIEWNPSGTAYGIYTIQMITSAGIQTKQIIYSPN